MSVNLPVLDELTRRLQKLAAAGDLADVAAFGSVVREPDPHDLDLWATGSLVLVRETRRLVDDALSDMGHFVDWSSPSAGSARVDLAVQTLVATTGHSLVGRPPTVPQGWTQGRAEAEMRVRALTDARQLAVCARSYALSGRGNIIAVIDRALRQFSRSPAMTSAQWRALRTPSTADLVHDVLGSKWVASFQRISTATNSDAALTLTDLLITATATAGVDE